MLPPIFQFRIDCWMIWNKLFFQKIILKHVNNICLRNLNKQCLKLDSRPILYAYNLLGYGETLSEQSWKSQNTSNIFKTCRCVSNISEHVLFCLKNMISGRFLMPTTSWDTGKHFLKNPEIGRASCRERV